MRGRLGESQDSKDELGLEPFLEHAGPHVSPYTPSCHKQVQPDALPDNGLGLPLRPVDVLE